MICNCLLMFYNCANNTENEPVPGLWEQARGIFDGAS